MDHDSHTSSSQCAQCGYQLCSTAGERCPECGGPANAPPARSQAWVRRIVLSWAVCAVAHAILTIVLLETTTTDMKPVLTIHPLAQLLIQPGALIADGSVASLIAALIIASLSWGLLGAACVEAIRWIIKA